MILIVLVLWTKPSGLYRHRRGLGLHKVGYNTQDFVPCPDGTLLCVEDKLGDPNVDLLPCNRLCVTLASSGIYINRRV